MNWKLRGRCYSCKRTRWFVAKRGVLIPQINQVAMSRDLMCGRCAKQLQGKIGNHA